MSTNIEPAREGLLGIGVPTEMVEDAIALIPQSTEGLLVYGSRARGDHIPDSDLDLLALVSPARKGSTRGQVSLSCYTRAQLATAKGTLFGVHLRRDSKLLSDPHGYLESALTGMGEVDTDRLFERIRRLSLVLDAGTLDRGRSLPGLVRQAKYLLRSALYGLAITEGEPCFSVRELAKRYRDPKLSRLLASRSRNTPTEEELEDLTDRLARVVGDHPKNHHGSLDALIVNEWGREADLVSVAVMARGHESSSDPYEEIDKVLL